MENIAAFEGDSDLRIKKILKKSTVHFFKKLLVVL